MQDSHCAYGGGKDRTDVYVAGRANGRVTGTLLMSDGSRYPFISESGAVLELLVDDWWVVHYPSGPSGLYDAFAGAYGRCRIRQVACRRTSG